MKKLIAKITDQFNKFVILRTDENYQKVKKNNLITSVFYIPSAIVLIGLIFNLVFIYQDSYYVYLAVGVYIPLVYSTIGMINTKYAKKNINRLKDEPYLLSTITRYIISIIVGVIITSLLYII